MNLPAKKRPRIARAARHSRQKSTRAARAMSPLEVGLVNVLSEHLGAKRGIHVDGLAQRMGLPERHVRRLISNLRHTHAVPVCAHPSTGYYMPTNLEELNSGMAFLERRALHSLSLIQRMRAAIPALAGQCALHQA